MTLPGGDETDTEPEGTWIVIETVTNWIDKHTAFYRGYLPDDRNLIPLTIRVAISWGFGIGHADSASPIIGQKAG